MLKQLKPRKPSLKAQLKDSRGFLLSPSGELKELSQYAKTAVLGGRDWPRGGRTKKIIKARGRLPIICSRASCARTRFSPKPSYWYEKCREVRRGSPLYHEKLHTKNAASLGQTFKGAVLKCADTCAAGYGRTQGCKLFFCDASCVFPKPMFCGVRRMPVNSGSKSEIILEGIPGRTNKTFRLGPGTPPSQFLGSPRSEILDAGTVNWETAHFVGVGCSWPRLASASERNSCKTRTLFTSVAIARSPFSPDVACGVL